MREFAGEGCLAEDQAGDIDRPPVGEEDIYSGERGKAAAATQAVCDDLLDIFFTEYCSFDVRAEGKFI